MQYFIACQHLLHIFLYNIVSLLKEVQKMLSENLKRKREELDMMQSEVARRINVTRQAISNWECGRTEPNIEMLGKLAKLYGCSKIELIEGRKPDFELKLSSDEMVFLEAYRNADSTQRMLAYAQLLKGR